MFGSSVGKTGAVGKEEKSSSTAVVGIGWLEVHLVERNSMRRRKGFCGDGRNWRRCCWRVVVWNDVRCSRESGVLGIEVRCLREE
jgi:hypothetical protein